MPVQNIDRAVFISEITQIVACVLLAPACTITVSSCSCATQSFHPHLLVSMAWGINCLNLWFKYYSYTIWYTIRRWSFGGFLLWDFPPWWWWTASVWWRAGTERPFCLAKEVCPHGHVEELFPSHLGKGAGWMGWITVHIHPSQLCTATRAAVTFPPRDDKLVRKICVWSQSEVCGWLFYFLIWETICYNPEDRDLFSSLSFSQACLLCSNQHSWN